MRFLSAVILVALLAVFTVRAADDKKAKDDPEKIGARKVDGCVNFYPIEMEIELGRRLADGYKPHDRVTGARVTEFVNRVGQNVARHSDAKIPMVFRVVKSDDPNAVAFPGGFVFVNTGMLRLAADEDELAAELGHEIAHVAARHGTCRMSLEKLLNVVSTLTVAVATKGTIPNLPQQMKLAITTAAVISYSRTQEAEADYLGVQYSYAAGYDPNGAVSLLEKYDRSHPDNVIDIVLGEHPSIAARIEKTQMEIQTILAPKPDYLVSTSESRDVRERVIRLEDRPENLKRTPAKDGNPPPKVQRKDAVE